MSFILTLQYSSVTPHINIYLVPFQHLPNWYCSPVLFSLTHAPTHSHKHFVNLVSSVVIYLCHLQPKMTPQERLKLRMQKALNKQCEYSWKCRNSSDLRACLNSPSLSPCVFLPVRRRVQDRRWSLQKLYIYKIKPFVPLCLSCALQAVPALRTSRKISALLLK